MRFAVPVSQADGVRPALGKVAVGHAKGDHLVDEALFPGAEPSRSGEDQVQLPDPCRLVACHS